MAKFHYKALKNNSVEVKGILEAETAAEARAKIVQLGFIPTNVFEETVQKPQIEQSRAITSLSLDDRILFTSELSVMFASGISTVEALETAQIHAHKPKIKILAEDIKNRILKGATFTDAIRAYEHVFGNIYIAMCEAGENSGTLDKSMEYLCNVLKKQNELKAKVISMSIYPICLILLLIGVFILCGKFVFPAFISGSNIDSADIPIMVKAMTIPCEMIFANWVSVALTAIAAIFGCKFVFSLDSFKKFLDKKLLKIPKVRDFVRYINLSSYFTVLHVSYESGVPISRAMSLSANSISNSVISHQAANAEKMVTNGQMISKAFGISELVPPVLNVLIASGEKAGRLGQMFRDAAIAVEKQLENATDVLTRAFEPVVMVIIGCAVGYVAIAFVQMYGSLIKALI